MLDRVTPNKTMKIYKKPGQDPWTSLVFEDVGYGTSDYYVLERANDGSLTYRALPKSLLGNDPIVGEHTQQLGSDVVLGKLGTAVFPAAPDKNALLKIIREKAPAVLPPWLKITADIYINNTTNDVVINISGRGYFKVKKDDTDPAKYVLENLVGFKAGDYTKQKTESPLYVNKIHSDGKTLHSGIIDESPTLKDEVDRHLSRKFLNNAHNLLVKLQAINAMGHEIPWVRTFLLEQVKTLGDAHKRAYASDFAGPPDGDRAYAGAYNPPFAAGTPEAAAQQNKWLAEYQNKSSIVEAIQGLLDLAVDAKKLGNNDVFKLARKAALDLLTWAERHTLSGAAPAAAATLAAGIAAVPADAWNPVGGPNADVRFQALKNLTQSYTIDVTPYDAVAAGIGGGAARTPAGFFVKVTDTSAGPRSEWYQVAEGGTVSRLAGAPPLPLGAVTHTYPNVKLGILLNELTADNFKANTALNTALETIAPQGVIRLMKSGSDYYAVAKAGNRPVYFKYDPIAHKFSDDSVSPPGVILTVVNGAPEVSLGYVSLVDGLFSRFGSWRPELKNKYKDPNPARDADPTNGINALIAHIRKVEYDATAEKFAAAIKNLNLIIEDRNINGDEKAGLLAAKNILLDQYRVFQASVEANPNLSAQYKDDPSSFAWTAEQAKELRAVLAKPTADKYALGLQQVASFFTAAADGPVFTGKAGVVGVACELTEAMIDYDSRDVRNILKDFRIRGRGGLPAASVENAKELEKYQCRAKITGVRDTAYIGRPAANYYFYEDKTVGVKTAAGIRKFGKWSYEPYQEGDRSLHKLVIASTRSNFLSEPSEVIPNDKSYIISTYLLKDESSAYFDVGMGPADKLITDKVRLENSRGYYRLASNGGVYFAPGNKPKETDYMCVGTWIHKGYDHDLALGEIFQIEYNKKPVSDKYEFLSEPLEGKYGENPCFLKDAEKLLAAQEKASKEDKADSSNKEDDIELAIGKGKKTRTEEEKIEDKQFYSGAEKQYETAGFKVEGNFKNDKTIELQKNNITVKYHKAEDIFTLSAGQAKRKGALDVLVDAALVKYKKEPVVVYHRNAEKAKEMKDAYEAKGAEVKLAKSYTEFLEMTGNKEKLTEENSHRKGLGKNGSS